VGQNKAEVSSGKSIIFDQHSSLFCSLLVPKKKVIQKIVIWCFCYITFIFETDAWAK